MGKLLLTCCFALCIRGEENSKNLLRDAGQRVMDTVERLPRYVCTQTVSRFRYEPDTALHQRSCDAILANAHGPAWKPRLSSSDRMRLDVAVSRDPSGVDGEMYSWAGAERFSVRDLFDIVPDGAMSTGTFSSMLASIFGGPAARFSYYGDSTVNERLVSEFGFRVPEERSGYLYLFGKDRSKQAKVPYDGTFLIDPETSDLVRLAVRTGALPAESGVCELARTVSYGRVLLNGASFLLPTEARVSIIHSDETVAKNIITYSACREFHGESTMRFELSPEVSGKDPPLQKEELPAGLPFKIVFTDRIDPAVAAAGDPIRAKLKTPIRDRSRVLVPEGALVTGRFVSVGRSYGPSKVRLAVAVKLESLEVGGKSQPFKASLDVGLQRFVKPAGALSLRVDVGSLDRSQDSESGIFEFWNADPDHVVESGVESSWLTVRP